MHLVESRDDQSTPQTQSPAPQLPPEGDKDCYNQRNTRHLEKLNSDVTLELFEADHWGSWIRADSSDFGI